MAQWPQQTSGPAKMQRIDTTMHAAQKTMFGTKTGGRVFKPITMAQRLQQTSETAKRQKMDTTVRAAPQGG